MTTKIHEPAFAAYGGMTKLEHAAILLRLPKSGDDAIDSMIREANRREFVREAMRIVLHRASMPDKSKRDDLLPQLASVAGEIADAFLAEAERA